MGRDKPGERPPACRHLARRGIPAASAGICLAVLPHLDFGANRPLAVLQALLVPLCLVALALCLFLLLRRAWMQAAVLRVCVGLSLVPMLDPAPKGKPVAGARCMPDAQLAVLSLNAGRGHADPMALAQVITEADPDVLVLVEASEEMLGALAQRLPGWENANRTGRVVTGGAVDTVVLSRYPLRVEAPAVRQSDGAMFDIPVAVIDHPWAGKIRMAGIHPAPPTHGPASWQDTLEAVDHWARHHRDLPLVLAGDFNATRAHPQFRTLAAGFHENAPSFGPVPLGTWPANSVVPAFAAIDHVLVRGMRTGDSERFVIPGTDHHGIVAQLGTC